MTKIFFVIKDKLNVLNWEIWRDLENYGEILYL